MLAANSMRFVDLSCIGLFLLITGYLKSEKPINAKYFTSLVPILISYIVITAGIYFCGNLIVGGDLSLKTLLKRILTFSYYSWYVEMYIGLVLFSPFINLAVKKISVPITKAIISRFA